MSEHRQREYRKTGSTYTAICVCGVQKSGPDRNTAQVALYSHIIDAGRECPTPEKKQYPCEEHARNAIYSFLRRPKPGARPARVYLCPSGRHWHTTKQAAPERRAA